MKIPEILISISGESIASVEKWEKYRRDEIYTLFENFVYGVAPSRPKNTEVIIQTMERESNILQKKVEICFPSYQIYVDVFLPLGQRKELPAFLYCMHQGQEERCDIDQSFDMEFLPVLDIIQRGYAVVVMKTSQLCPDVFEGKPYAEGIFKALDTSRPNNAWANIAAWAWGLRIVMDYLQQDEDIDGRRVAVIGHSRSGKTALWAGACDPRFALVISNNSGCTGAALAREKKGEHIADINGAFPWFCENYTKYNNNEIMLPVDQHMLIALIAPRPVYIASSSNDEWADPDSELWACRLASDVYRLYGFKGASVPDIPEENKGYHDGRIAYHRKTGEHSLTQLDWSLFMDFADKHL